MSITVKNAKQDILEEACAHSAEAKAIGSVSEINSHQLKMHLADM